MLNSFSRGRGGVKWGEGVRGGEGEGGEGGRAGSRGAAGGGGRNGELDGRRDRNA